MRAPFTNSVPASPAFLSLCQDVISILLPRIVRLDDWQNNLRLLYAASRYSCRALTDIYSILLE